MKKRQSGAEFAALADNLCVCGHPHEYRHNMQSETNDPRRPVWHWLQIRRKCHACECVGFLEAPKDICDEDRWLAKP